jgi:hypothetical protein
LGWWATRCECRLRVAANWGILVSIGATPFDLPGALCDGKKYLKKMSHRDQKNRLSR